VSNVVIFGIGDFGRIAHLYLKRDSEHEVVAFTVHGHYLDDKSELNGLPIVPFEVLEGQFPPGEVSMLVAAGFSKVNAVRARIYEECKRAGYRCISYTSSKAMVWPDLPIGDNCFIFEANVVQPGVKIGNDVVLWSGNHVGHDVTIGDHCFIASHAVISGNVTIGHHCFVGVNATFRDGVTVAPRCVIGAGALIMRDTDEGGVYSVPGTKPHDKKSWDLRGF
jgi:sugar O-acyltransferase (sialic acid O-acetyltransferase NeuD family)